MSDEDDEIPGVPERISKEVNALQRHFEVLEIVLRDGPIGIVKISENLGTDHSKIRYSLRVLEEEQLIESTSEGAAATNKAREKVTEYNHDIDQLRSRIITAAEETGIEIGSDNSSIESDTPEPPLDQFVQNASLDSITDRFGSFDPLVEHDDVEVRKAAIQRLVEIADEEPSRVSDLATIPTIAGLFAGKNKKNGKAAMSLLDAIVEDDPSIVEPALPVLFDLINDDAVLMSQQKIIQLFVEVGSSTPETAREAIEQEIEKLNSGDREPVNLAQSLYGVATSENGADLLRPFVSVIVELLDETEEEVRIPTADTIRVLADNDSIPLYDHHERIGELLEDDSSQVRKIAIEILTRLTVSTAVISKIQELADNDPDEEVRAAASDYLKTVQSSSSEEETVTNASDRHSELGTTDTADITDRLETNPSSASSSASQKNDTRPAVDENRSNDRIPTLSNMVEAASIELTYDQFQFDDETDLIGAGGQARVYHADVDGEDLTVALKQPSFNETISEEVYNSILNEARNWSRWDDHPHIVQVIDWGVDPGPWIALEYMDGGPLREYLETMELEQRLWTTYAISTAVARANTKGLVHHDLKPNNILFDKTPDDQWDIPKVADWGLSRELIQATGSISQATPEYAAPEHFNALMPDAPVDERTEVYQLGVVCYEILTGTHPSHLKGEVAPPTDVDDSLPDSVDDIITTAIAHDRSERFEHSLLFKRAIERALSDDFPSIFTD